MIPGSFRGEVRTLRSFELLKCFFRFVLIVLLALVVQPLTSYASLWSAVIIFLFAMNTLSLFLYVLRPHHNRNVVKAVHFISLGFCLSIFSILVLATGGERSEFYLFFVFYLTLLPILQIGFSLLQKIISQVAVFAAYPTALLVFGAISSVEILFVRSVFLLVIAATTIVFSFILQQEHKQLEEANVRLQNLAITDPLTGLYNRRFLREELYREIEIASRLNMALSVIIGDIDYFKEYNDRYGHPAGDQLLVSVAEIAKNHTRRMDIAARYGGEEFMIVLPATSKIQAATIAERIRCEVQDAITIDDAYSPTISFGVATYPIDAEVADDLIKAADMAMYTAKRNGRNRVVASSKATSPFPALPTYGTAPVQGA